MQVLGDENRQWAEQHPDREAQIEIQEAGDESRQMTRFEKSAFFMGMARVSAQRRCRTVPDANRH